MEFNKCRDCGAQLRRVTVKREGKWYCPVCKAIK